MTPDPKYTKKPYKPKRAQKSQLLSRMVEKIVKPVFGKRGFSNAAIITNWAEIVGPELARFSAPEKLTFSRDGSSGGILHLKTITGGMATEIQHLEPIIIERINRHFGYKAVVGLRLSQGPIPQEESTTAPEIKLSQEQELALNESLKNIEDEEIRLTLARLGKSIVGRNRGES
ncbi:MAG: DciA family protein [Rhodospirillaceae bacterium]|nr:DciA family protein [Rhodospirillaceae bacterium]